MRLQPHIFLSGDRLMSSVYSLIIREVNLFDGIWSFKGFL